jgi:hypothetical protein
MGRPSAKSSKIFQVLRKSFFGSYSPLSVSLSLDRAAKLNFVFALNGSRSAIPFFTFPWIGTFGSSR